MKKSLIAVAVAAGMAAPLAANAGVTTYGQLYASMNSIDNDGTAQVTQNDNDGRGRIGFKAAEELGGGMTAFAKLEMQIDANDAEAAGGCTKNTDNTSSVYCQRDSFVGLKAGWGSISAGRMHGAYKTAGGVKWDPFVATHLQARGNGGMAKGAYAQNGFVSQLVQYKSPKISGFQVQYQTSILSDDDDATKTGSEGDALYSIKYTGVKGLTLLMASAKQAGTTTGGTEDKVNTKFGAKYKIGKKMAVTLQSESTEAASSAGDYTYLNFSYKMGKHNFVVANGTHAADAADKDVSYFAVGDVIKLSKKTHLTVGYRSTNTETGATTDKDYTSFTVGLRQNF